ncbi:MAG: DNA glycosylase [Tissierellia bacterium]|nr:DNA glycosylase [Tissierellia bacterium]
MEKEKKVYKILKKDLNLKGTLESGQVFRYQSIGHRFIVHAKDQQVIIEEKEKEYHFLCCSDEEFKFWKNYFAIDMDYYKIRNTWHWNPLLEEAYEYGKGIRILRQDPFETIINFIISANSHIPRIKKSIELICKKWGRYVPGEVPYYTFPTPEELSKGTVQELRNIGKVGYRDKYIYNTVKLIHSGEKDISSFYELDTLTLDKELQTLPGVGKKVSQCILLFGFGRMEAFPIDTWMKRVLQEGLNMEKIPKNPIEFGKLAIGEGAGLAQQYYFYYTRSKGGVR